MPTQCTLQVHSIHTHACTHTPCTHACTHTPMHPCMHACTHSHTHAYTHTHTHTHTLSLSLTHTHTHTHTLSLSHTHTHTHTHTLSLSLSHTIWGPRTDGDKNGHCRPLLMTFIRHGGSRVRKRGWISISAHYRCVGKRLYNATFSHNIG